MKPLVILVPFILALLPGCVSVHSNSWQLAFSDAGSGDWQQHWFLEGDKATVQNTGEGMVFSAGPVPGEQASHAVLWTRQSFSGDVKIEYDYTRMDAMTNVTAVNILYIQAAGLGTDASPTDILLSTRQRAVPWMKHYFLNMNALHISYAASGPERSQYVSARRYPAQSVAEFEVGTQVQPVYENVHLFEPGKTYHITAIKRGQHLSFTVASTGRKHEFEWDISAFPPVTEGRVGFRQMWARSSCYRNIRVYVKD